MLETPHVAVGIAIATKIPNPYIAIPLAFLSHFALDKIPHWNPHFYTETKKNGMPHKESTTLAVGDIIIALVLGTSVAVSFLPDYKKAALIMACSFASVLSDVVKMPFYYLKKRSGFLKKWVDWERSLQVEVKPFWGVLTQVLIIITSLYFALST